jgi:2-oxo-4-hydroxy-4-carboxy-5-ureidoimidazoline decarboxylase
VSERDAFVARYGGLFEHSPWVAEAAWDADGPFADDEAALAAMVAAVQRAPRERRLALIRAHPDLAGRAAIAGELTADSAREQAAAGLDRLTPDEYAEFTATNAAYRERHGFPFVICAREHDKTSILAAAAERRDHDTEAEVGVALGEIAKIARLRLEDLP